MRRTQLRSKILELAACVAPDDPSWSAVRDLEDFINEHGDAALDVVTAVILDEVQTDQAWDERRCLQRFLSYGPEIGDEAWRIELLRACLGGDSAVRQAALEPLDHWIHRLSPEFNRAAHGLLAEHFFREPDEDIREDVRFLVRTLIARCLGGSVRLVSRESTLWLHPGSGITSRTRLKEWIQDEFGRQGALSAWDLGMDANHETAAKVALNLGAVKGAISNIVLHAVPKSQFVASNDSDESAAMGLLRKAPDNLAISEIANRHYEIFGDVEALTSAIFSSMRNVDRRREFDARELLHLFKRLYRAGRIDMSASRNVGLANIARELEAESRAKIRKSLQSNPVRSRGRGAGRAGSRPRPAGT